MGTTQPARLGGNKFLVLHVQTCCWQVDGVCADTLLKLKLIQRNLKPLHLMEDVFFVSQRQFVVPCGPFVRAFFLHFPDPLEAMKRMAQRDEKLWKWREAMRVQRQTAPLRRAQGAPPPPPPGGGGGGGGGPPPPPGGGGGGGGGGPPPPPPGPGGGGGSPLFKIPLNDLQPKDEFLCPGVPGCFIPKSYVNDRKCDCPETCADEAAFTCETCVPATPIGGPPPKPPTQTALGVSLGVGLGVALGVGLGVGLGLSAGIGAYLAEGEIQLAVKNAQQFISSPQVQQAIKSSLVRLASAQISVAAVQLIWGCAIDAVSSRKLRRLGEIVDLCFEIDVAGEQEGLQVCSSLENTPQGIAESVINEELEETGVGGGVEVVLWTANPNPRAKAPGAVSNQPLPSLNTGVDLGS